MFTKTCHSTTSPSYASEVIFPPLLPSLFYGFSVECLFMLSNIKYFMLAIIIEPLKVYLVFVFMFIVTHYSLSPNIAILTETHLPKHISDHFTLQTNF